MHKNKLLTLQHETYYCECEKERETDQREIKGNFFLHNNKQIFEFIAPSSASHLFKKSLLQKFNRNACTFLTAREKASK
jgi:hypothetical protein